MVAQSCSPLAHKGLLTAAKVLALSCIRTMDRPDVIEAAKKEVTKRNGGHYTCPLPDSVQPPLDTERGWKIKGRRILHLRIFMSTQNTVCWTDPIR